MLSFLRSALYVKNVPKGERAVRIVAALAIVIGALSAVAAPWNWILVAAGGGLGLSGLIGFCPACALVGRRLQQRR
ncbi:YgaP family membrane protein [Cupriavidus sp. CP313]